MHQWTPFPHAGAYPFDAATVRDQWPRLHAGDVEPPPENTRVAEAWALFHSGAFQQARDAGLRAGGSAGTFIANMATCIYACHLEKREDLRLELLMEVAERARRQCEEDATNPNAWYSQAYALGRYSQSISIAKSLAQGLGKRIKDALEKTIQLQPAHANAHIALGTFHAEVIDKLGPLIAGMTYGARKETGLQLFESARRLNPTSAVALRACAKGLLMLEGPHKHAEARQLYERAAGTPPQDAKEWLDADLARAELEN